MKLLFTKRAAKDFAIIEKEKKYKKKCLEILELLEEDPFKYPPAFEKLLGEENTYSRRLNIQHRIVYRVEGEYVVLISLWTHYE